MLPATHFGFWQLALGHRPVGMAGTAAWARGESGIPPARAEASCRSVLGHPEAARLGHSGLHPGQIVAPCALQWAFGCLWGNAQEGLHRPTVPGACTRAPPPPPAILIACIGSNDFCARLAGHLCAFGHTHMSGSHGPEMILHSLTPCFWREGRQSGAVIGADRFRRDALAAGRLVVFPHCRRHGDRPPERTGLLSAEHGFSTL